VDRGYSLLTGFYDQGVGVVDRIDRALGDPRLDDVDRKVRLDTGLETVLREDDRWDVNARLNARIPLPAMERRFNLFLDLGAEELSSAGLLDTSLTPEDSNLRAQLQLHVPFWQKFGTGVSLRGRWEGGLQANLSPFIRYEDESGPWRWYVREEVSHDTRDHFQERTSGNLDYVLGEFGFLRLATDLTVKEGRKALFLHHALILRHLAGASTVMSYEVGTNHHVWSGEEIEEPREVYALVRWTGRVWRPWLELQLEPEAVRDQDTGEVACSLACRVTFLYERFRTPMAPEAPPP
jgi:hypothetical protein